MCSDVAITIQNLSKTYFLYAHPSDRLKQYIFRWRQWFTPFEALKPLNLTIKRGETVGIVGRNGSGKSTLLQLICGTVFPTGGTVKVDGRISALLELGAGFNPEFSGCENIYMNGALLGMSRREITEKYDAIVTFSGIDAAHIAQPVKTYSSGMYVRLAFAVAVASDPEVLIVDEALSVGDAAFQRKCFSRIQQMQQNGTTILFVSHAPGTVQELCTRAILMDGGEMLMDGSPKAVLGQYHRLLFAPEAQVGEIREAIRGGVPQEGVEEGGQLDAGMQPESTVTYVPRGAEISNPRITTLAGEEVNVLTRGETYQYHYTVTFTEEASGVRFGMNLKTLRGVVLGGATSHTEKQAIASLPEGTVLEVCFRFCCRLLPGNYFTNAGCSGMVEGERVMLHRIVDACMFRVADEAELTATGTVDFEAQASIKGL
ncbi:MAG: ABC transporter ATP-binding protein [Hyphomicrobiales bacterium]|nr:ABC transporter ATP-binding protein [Hyphomicrobiales bacterium]